MIELEGISSPRLRTAIKIDEELTNMEQRTRVLKVTLKQLLNDMSNRDKELFSKYCGFGEK